MSIDSVIPSHHLILCHPLLLPPSIFPSIRVFSSESALCIRWPKYWSISFSISHFNEYSRLISFGIDYLDILAVQVTRRSLLQHHSSKASILQWSAFFTVQLSHPYMATGKTIALTRQTFVGKVMSLITTQAPTKKRRKGGFIVSNTWVQRKVSRFVFHSRLQMTQTMIPKSISSSLFLWICYLEVCSIFRMFAKWLQQQ